MINNKKLSIYICEALVIISYLALISFSVFEIFTQISLYILLLAILALMVLINNVRTNNAILVILVCLYLLVSIIITSGGIGSVLTFILPIILLFVLERIRFNHNTCNLIKNLSLIVLAYVFIRSFSYASDWNYHRFNDINPNTMSMYLLFAYMYFTSFMDENTKHKRLKLLSLTAISLWSLYNYESRASMVVLALYFITVLFIKKISLKSIYIFAVIFILLGILFPVIYLQLYRKGVTLEIFGKSLYTGREIIWSNMFDAFNENRLAWLVGLGSRVTFWNDKELNVHNNAFAIIVDFGLIGFLIFYIFILKKLKAIKSDSVRIKKLLLAFVFFAFLLGLTEVTTLWTTTYVLAFFGFGIALSMDRCSRERINE